MEKAGIEPATSCLLHRRSPNVSYIPRVWLPDVFEARACNASSYQRAGKGSNLRPQGLRALGSATELPARHVCPSKWNRQASNLGPSDYESDALTN